VCYRAIPIPSTTLVKDFMNGESPKDYEYTKTFTDWNNACVVEEGKILISLLNSALKIRSNISLQEKESHKQMLNLFLYLRLVSLT